MGSQSVGRNLATKQGRLLSKHKYMCCQVMMLSYMSTKQMLFSVLTRKGRSLGTTFLPPDPPRSRSWLKRQISVGSSLRPYSADTTEGTRCPGPNRPSDSSGQPMAGARPHRLWPEGHCHYFTEAGIGEKFTATSRPQPDQWAVLARALEPWNSPQTVPGHPHPPPAHMLTWGLLSWRAPCPTSPS